MWKKNNWSKWMCVLTKTMTNKQTLCDLLPAFIKWKVYHFMLSGVKECMYLYEQMSSKCEASTFQNNFIPLLKKKKKDISKVPLTLISNVFCFFLMPVDYIIEMFGILFSCILWAEECMFIYIPFYTFLYSVPNVLSWFWHILRHE